MTTIVLRRVDLHYTSYYHRTPTQEEVDELVGLVNRCLDVCLFQWTCNWRSAKKFGRKARIVTHPDEMEIELIGEEHA